MCWIKAVGLELAVVILIAAALIILVATIFSALTALENAGETRGGQIAIEILKYVVVTGVFVVVLSGIIFMTIGAKNAICARGFKGAWHQVWAGQPSTK